MFLGFTSSACRATFPADTAAPATLPPQLPVGRVRREGISFYHTLCESPSAGQSRRAGDGQRRVRAWVRRHIRSACKPNGPGAGCFQVLSETEFGPSPQATSNPPFCHQLGGVRSPFDTMKAEGFYVRTNRHCQQNHIEDLRGQRVMGSGIVQLGAAPVRYLSAFLQLLDVKSLVADCCSATSVVGLGTTHWASWAKLFAARRPSRSPM